MSGRRGGQLGDLRAWLLLLLLLEVVAVVALGLGLGSFLDLGIFNVLVLWFWIRSRRISRIIFLLVYLAGRVEGLNRMWKCFCLGY